MESPLSSRMCSVLGARKIEATARDQGAETYRVKWAGASVASAA
jgi:hypothetical protein